jgi:hypothetical protein
MQNHNLYLLALQSAAARPQPPDQFWCSPRRTALAASASAVGFGGFPQGRVITRVGAGFLGTVKITAEISQSAEFLRFGFSIRPNPKLIFRVLREPLPASGSESPQKGWRVLLPGRLKAILGERCFPKFALRNRSATCNRSCSTPCRTRDCSTDWEYLLTPAHWKQPKSCRSAGRE